MLLNLEATAAIVFIRLDMVTTKISRLHIPECAACLLGSSLPKHTTQDDSKRRLQYS